MAWGGGKRDETGGYGGAFFDPVTGRPVDTGDWDPSRPYTTGPEPGPQQPNGPAPYQAGQPYQQAPPQQPPLQGSPYQQGQPYQQAPPYRQPPQHGHYQQPKFAQTYQQPHWPPPTAPSSPPPGRSHIRLGAVFATVAGFVVLVALGGGIAYVADAGDDTEGSAQPAPIPSSSSASSTSSRPAETSSTGTPATTAPVVTGWQGVLDEKDGLAYDVPRQWEVDEPGTITGYEKPDKSGSFGYKPLISGHSPAEYRGDCTGRDTHRGLTAVIGAGDLAPDRAASGAAVLWLQGATMAENGKAHHFEPPKPGELRLRSGGRAPIATLAGGSLERGGECAAPRVRVTTVAVEQGGKTRVLVIETDQRVPKGVDEATVRKIAASLRPSR